MSNYGIELYDAANQKWTENDWLSQVRFTEVIASSKKYELGAYMSNPENGFVVATILDYSMDILNSRSTAALSTPLVQKIGNLATVTNPNKANVLVIIGEQNG